jgi:hypothetical protein
MSFIHCSSDCTYQQDGYCGLEKAAEITNCVKADGCLRKAKKTTILDTNSFKSLSKIFCANKFDSEILASQILKVLIWQNNAMKTQS